MYYGVAYYPEHWPEERWPVDAELMQAAGVNSVRMGEFAWSKIEPVEGEYDFDWMDRAIALFGKHGVKTMMCTMSVKRRLERDISDNSKCPCHRVGPRLAGQQQRCPGRYRAC
jgi:beta-galactosidase GanA